VTPRPKIYYPARSQGKMVEDDKYAGFYKQRSYKFTNKRLGQF